MYLRTTILPEEYLQDRKIIAKPSLPPAPPFFCSGEALRSKGPRSKKVLGFSGFIRMKHETALCRLLLSLVFPSAPKIPSTWNPGSKTS